MEVTRKSKKHASYDCLSYVDKQTHPSWVHPGTLLQLINRAPCFHQSL